MTIQRNAVALTSSSLDSTLAETIILDQGIDVRGFNFFLVFCDAGPTRETCTHDLNKNGRKHARWVTDQSGVNPPIIARALHGGTRRNESAFAERITAGFAQGCTAQQIRVTVTQYDAHRPVVPLTPRPRKPVPKGRHG